MDDLNFTNELKESKTATGSIYSAGAALKFFKSLSKEQDIAAGEIIFEEEIKGNRLLLQRDKMYLLVKGLVELTVKGKLLGVVKQGEIFGEMATLCRGLSRMDRKTHVRFSGGYARATAHGYPTNLTLTNGGYEV